MVNKDVETKEEGREKDFVLLFYFVI